MSNRQKGNKHVIVTICVFIHFLLFFLFYFEGKFCTSCCCLFSPSFLIVSPVLFIVFFVTLVFPLPFEAALGVFLDY